MNLAYAVDRLVEAGWLNTGESELEFLPDGRPYPSVSAIQREFALVGLELSIKQNLMFSCYHATWSPSGYPLDDSLPSDARHGTVVGACQREAAVFALAQLRSSQSRLQLLHA